MLTLWDIGLTWELAGVGELRSGVITDKGGLRFHSHLQQKKTN